MARELLTRPSLLLLDEPTSGLDPGLDAIGLLSHPEPRAGALPALGPLLELMAVVAALEFAWMCLGLPFAALVKSPENAIQAVVVLIMIEVAGSAGLFPVAGIPVIAQVALLVPARWGMAALACAVRLVNAPPDPLWKHTSGQWLLDVVMMLAPGLACTAVAGWKLSRLRPGGSWAGCGRAGQRASTYWCRRNRLVPA